MTKSQITKAHELIADLAKKADALLPEEYSDFEFAVAMAKLEGARQMFKRLLAEDIKS